MPDVFKKLNLKNQREIVVLGAPESFEVELAGLSGVTVRRELGEVAGFEFALVFVTTQAQLDEVSAALVVKAQGDAVLWMAYPKQSSKRYRCDFNRDTGWRVLGEAGWEGVRMVAIDEDWSALRFRRLAHITKFQRAESHAISPAGKARAAAKAAGAVLLGLLTLAAAPPIEPARFYRATLAAAASSLRLHDVAEARRWLDEAPVGERGWEWRHLAARSQQSSAQQRAHEAPANGVAVSPDGKLLATTSHDRTVRLWDAATLAPLRTLSGHTHNVWTARFSPDGTRLVSASSDGTARVWDVASGQEVLKLTGVGSGIAAAAFDPTGREIAVSSWKRSAERGVWGVVTVWDAATGTQLQSLEHGIKPIVALAWSPDGTRLAVGTWDADVAIWSRPDWGPPVRLMPPASSHYQAVQSLAWSADGRELAVGAKDGRVRVWDVASATLRLTFFGQAEGQAQWVNGLAARPDGGWWSAQADGTLRAFAGDGREEATWHAHRAPITALAVAPGAARAFTVSGDGELRAWDFARLAPERSTWRPGNESYEVAFHPDGTRAAHTGWTGFVHVREVATGKLLASWQGHDESGVRVAWSRDGERLATTGNDGRVRLWRPNGEAVATLEDNAKRQLGSVAFSPDSQWVAAPAREGEVKVWRATDGALETVLAEPDNRAVWQVAWSPDGRQLVTTARDGKVVLWDWPTRRVTKVLEQAPGLLWVDFHPRGNLLAVASSARTVTLWDVVRGEKVREMKGHGAQVETVRFSPDGFRLASAAGDGTVRLWDVMTGELLLTLPFDAAVYGAVWSPNGLQLVVLPLDGTVRVLESGG